MTGVMMARHEMGAGERAFAKKRGRIRRVIAIGVAAGALIGFAMGFFDAHHGSDAPLSPTVAILGVLLITIGLIGGARLYFREVDELDLRDNLIAGNAGMYFFVAAYPSWLLLARAGLVGEPELEPLYISSLMVVLAAYVWKRLRP